MTDKRQKFADLHRPGKPLILYNIWDAGSAEIVTRSGAKAIATGSNAVAEARGFEDGEDLPFDIVLKNAKNIVRITDLPVTVDLESGYGKDAESVEECVAAVRATGVVGINLEDQDLAKGGIRALSEQVKRVQAASKTGIFVNARTDLFIQIPAEEHDVNLANQALERCCAYADAGAESFFIPLLTDEMLIAHICENSPLPVNCMMKPGGPSLEKMAELGVARISFGSTAWAAAMAYLEQEAIAIYS